MSKSFLQIQSKAIGKTLLALLCGIFLVNISIILIYLIVGLNCYLSELGEDIPSQFVTFEYFFQGLGYLSILMIIAFCDFLLVEKAPRHMAIASPMAVPCVGTMLVLVSLRKSFAAPASPVMGICI